MDFSQHFILLVIDTETTGLSSRSGNRVVDLAVQALFWDAQSQTLKVLESAQWYFNPQRASEPGAARIHRLSQSFLQSQPPAEEQMPKIIKWIRGAITGGIDATRSIDIWLVAHNAIFDIGFVNSEMRHAGLTGTFAENAQASGVLCTKRLFQTAAPTAGKYSQNALCEWANVDTSTRRNAKGEEVHGALADCRLLASALLQMRRKLGTEQFAAACRRSLLDAASVATLDSKKYPAFASPDAKPGRTGLSPGRGDEPEQLAKKERELAYAALGEGVKRLEDILPVLIYVGKAGGQFRKPKRELVYAVVRRAAAPTVVSEEQLNSIVWSQDAPTPKAIRAAIDRIAAKSPKQMAALHKIASRIVASRKASKPKPAELEILEYMARKL